MQSVGRVSAARSLALSLANESCSKSTLTIASAATIINNRIFSRLFNNLRYLTQSIAYQKRQTRTEKHHHQQIYNLANSTQTSPNYFIFSSLSAKPLHLVTAYSGYSKQFIDNKVSYKFLA